MRQKDYRTKQEIADRYIKYSYIFSSRMEYARWKAGDSRREQRREQSGSRHEQAGSRHEQPGSRRDVAEVPVQQPSEFVQSKVFLFPSKVYGQEVYDVRIYTVYYCIVSQKKLLGLLDDIKNLTQRYKRNPGKSVGFFKTLKVAEKYLQNLELHGINECISP